MASGFDGLADIFMSHKTDEQPGWAKMLAGMGIIPGPGQNSYVVNQAPVINQGPAAAGSNVPGK